MFKQYNHVILNENLVKNVKNSIQKLLKQI